MRVLCAAAFAVILIAVPSLEAEAALVKRSTSTSAAASRAKGRSHAKTHSVSGVVKRIDDSHIVIARSGAKNGELDIQLSEKTKRSGGIAPGERAAVSYRVSKGVRTATVVKRQPTRVARSAGHNRHRVAAKRRKTIPPA